MVTCLRTVLVLSALVLHLTISDPEPDPALGLFGGAGALLGYCANGGVSVRNQSSKHLY